jgi:hypothetical protein
MTAGRRRSNQSAERPLSCSRRTNRAAVGTTSRRVIVQSRISTPYRSRRVTAATPRV